MEILTRAMKKHREATALGVVDFPKREVVGPGAGNHLHKNIVVERKSGIARLLASLCFTIRKSYPIAATGTLRYCVSGFERPRE
jgi:hypothetical protein